MSSLDGLAVSGWEVPVHDVGPLRQDDETAVAVKLAGMKGDQLGERRGERAGGLLGGQRLQGGLETGVRVREQLLCRASS
ncbi:hypothetical protein ACIHFD_67835 [Nonomuraea sp. NPDC051941]|uniref:hypothetical protein n=1 Tax=Nonomuraea sp. NPDC051941 TaxID=3364373 RepID=UPI0037CB4561